MQHNRHKAIEIKGSKQKLWGSRHQGYLAAVAERGWKAGAGTVGAALGGRESWDVLP